MIALMFQFNTVLEVLNVAPLELQSFNPHLAEALRYLAN